MSWDEKDWAYTWITGKQSRINLLFRKFNVEDITKDNNEVCVTIKEYNRDVCEFGIMPEQDMKKTAQIYGIMIEHRYLGWNRHCFDYRKENCILSNINLKSPSPFGGGDLNIYRGLGYRSYRGAEWLQISNYKDDLKIMNIYLHGINEKIFNPNSINNYSTNISEFERKRKNEVKRIIKSLENDIKTLHEINHETKYQGYIEFEGKLNRLDSLFGNFNSQNKNKDIEVKAVFYTDNPKFYNNDASTSQKINELACKYGICIHYGTSIFDYRKEQCEKDLNNINPLIEFNLRHFIHSYSTYDFNT